jgi:hypothetical protein
MRKLGAKVVAVALLGTLASVAVAQDAPDSKPAPPKHTTWGGSLFNWGEKSPDKAEEVKGAMPVPAGPSPLERSAREQERLRKAVLRRMQVCQQLRQIAEQTDDAELMQRADELDARAWEIYRQQAARLGLPMSVEEAISAARPMSQKDQRGEDLRGDREGGR